MTNVRLVSARLKVERANAHISELTHLGVGSSLGGGYRFTVHPDTERGGRQVVLLEFTTARSAISAIVGEIIYQLRSALDVSVNQVARAAGVENTRHIYFPFCSSEAEFDRENGEVAKKLVGVPDNVRAKIRDLQPWTGGNEALTGLNKLRNEDVHNDLLTLSCVVGNLFRASPHHVLEGSLAAQLIVRIIASGAIAGEPRDTAIDVTDLAPDLPQCIDIFNEHCLMQTEQKFSATVAFPGEPVIPLLSQLSIVIEEVIELIEHAAVNGAAGS